MSKTQDRKGDCGRQLRLPKALKYVAYKPGSRAGAGGTVAAPSSFCLLRIFFGGDSSSAAWLPILLFGRRAGPRQCASCDCATPVTKESTRSTQIYTRLRQGVGARYTRGPNHFALLASCFRCIQFVCVSKASILLRVELYTLPVHVSTSSTNYFAHRPAHRTKSNLRVVSLTFLIQVMLNTDDIQLFFSRHTSRISQVQCEALRRHGRIRPVDAVRGERPFLTADV